jgi:cytochrome d ubiquinol oxidase subunit II
MKTDDQLQNSMYRLMPKLILALLLIFAAVSIYTPLAFNDC